MQILVTARFIDVAVSVAQGSAKAGDVIPHLALVVALILHTRVAGTLSSFSRVRIELGLRRSLRRAITERRAKLSYRYIEDPEMGDLISRVAKEPGAQAKNAYRDFIGFISKIARIAGVLAILFAQVWWAELVILAFSVPLFVSAVFRVSRV